MLRRHGLQVTPQRVAVLQAVSEQPHRTAEEVLTAARAQRGSISRQAVYDALGAFTATGLLRRVQPAGSPARYEDRVEDNHHHVVCRLCGRMSDIDCDEAQLPDVMPAHTSGYAIEQVEVIYWGRCPECQSRSPQLPE